MSTGLGVHRGLISVTLLTEQCDLRCLDVPQASGSDGLHTAFSWTVVVQTSVFMAVSNPQHRHLLDLVRLNLS